MYPTIEEVEEASREQICRWYRFLPSPGMSGAGSTYIERKKIIDEEALIMKRIQERLEIYGGFTPELSKRIGWGECGR